MIDAGSEQKFLLLKKRLDALHYCQPLTIESAALVERLLNDLIKTTEGFTGQKRNQDQLQKQLIKAENYLQPLKSENHKLQKENNELHLQMIKIKEENDYNNTRWRTQEKSMQGELSDMKFVIDQKESKLRKLEQENVTIKQKMDQFMQKVFLPSAQNGLENMPPEYINENARNYTNISLGKKQGFELTKTLNQDQQLLAEELFGKKENDYEQWQQSLKVADERNEKMKKELNRIAEEKAIIDEQLQHAQLQLSNRDQEISRLQSKLDIGSVNIDKMSNDFQLQQQIEKVERLNHQIDFLSKENTRLESTGKSQENELQRTKTLREDNKELQQLVQSLNHKLEHAKFNIQNQDCKTQEITSSLEKKYQSEISELESTLSAYKQQIQVKEDQIESLNSRIENLFYENEKLQVEAQKSSSLVAAYQSDKKAFASSLQAMKTDQEGQSQVVDNLNQLLNEKNEQIEKLNEELVQFQQRLQASQRELSLNSKNHERLISENKLANEDIKKYKSTINLIEQENVTLLSQKNEYQTEMERALQSKQYLEEQIEKAKNETYKIRGDIDSKSVQQERVEVLLEGERSDNERLKKEIQTLEVLLQNSKDNYREAELKSNDYFNQLKAQAESVKEVEKQHKTTSDLLSYKIKELRESENVKIELERELYELRTTKKQLEELKNKQKQNLSDTSSLELQRIKFNKQIDDLKMENMEKQEDIDQLKSQLSKVTSQNEQIQKQLFDLENQSNGNQTNQLKLQEREQQYSELLGEVQRYKEKERKLIQENSTLETNLRQAETLIKNGTKNVEMLSNQKAELLEDIKQLQDRLSNSNYAKSDTVSKQMQLQEKVNNQDIHINDLKQSLEKQERVNENLQSELSLLTSEINNQKLENQDLQQNIKSLTVLAEGLERTKQELFEKLKQKGQENNNIEQTHEQTQKQIFQLKQEIQNITDELQATRQNMIEIDQNRDQIQDTLDQKYEENDKLKKLLDQNEVEFQKLKEKCIQMQGKSDNGTQRVIDLEQQLKSNQEKFQKLMQELDNQKYTIQVKQKEVNDLSNDLNVLVRENQNANNQLVKVISERDSAREQLNALNIEDKKFKQTFRATQMEKSDILNNYREVSLENERLQRNITDLSHENQQILIKIKEYERELSGLTQQLNHYQKKEQQMHADIHALERQQTYLTKRLEQEELGNQELIKEKENIFKEYENMRMVNEGMSNHRDEFQKSIMHQQNEKNFLQDQITQLKREADVQKSQIEYERQRAQQLEEVIIKERQNQHKGQLEFSQTIGEKEEITRQIDQLKVKNQNLQNYINKLENDKKLNDSQNMDRSNIKEQNQNEHLTQQLQSKTQEVQQLLHEQRFLREENSKLRIENLKKTNQLDEMSYRSQNKSESGSNNKQLYNEIQNISQQVNQCSQQISDLKQQENNSDYGNDQYQE